MCMVNPTGIKITHSDPLPHPLLLLPLDKPIDDWETRITFIRLFKNPRTDITTSIPMNKRDIYCPIGRREKSDFIRTC